MFDLVADVERYPEFVPGYRAVRVLARETALVQTEQVVALGGFELRFRSRAELDRPRLIRVRSADGPFRELQVDWRFGPLADGACRLEVHTAYSLEPRLMARLARTLFDELVAAGLGAFEQRARQLYGTPSIR